MNHTTTVGADFPRMLRVGEAAKLLHVHPNTLRKWNSCGLVPSYRIGRRGDRRFAVADLVKFLAAGSGSLQEAAAAGEKGDGSARASSSGETATLAAGWVQRSPGEAWRF